MTDEQKMNAAMIECSQVWPHGSVLPMKRLGESAGDWPEIGTLHAEDPTTVLLVPFPMAMELTDDQRGEVARRSYESAKAMVVDGWIVD